MSSSRSQGLSEGVMRDEQSGESPKVRTNANVATMTGTVVQVVKPPRESRKHVLLLVDWDLCDKVKRAEVKIGNVLLASSQSTRPEGAITGDLLLSRKQTL